MRYQEFRQVLKESAKVGREYQHLEDLVFVDGSAGAIEAADILDGLGTDAGDVAIKWDGNPTVYFGREPDGTFVLVGKNGWGRNMSTSAEDLANFIKQSGKGVEQEPWREEFGNNMAEIFNIIETNFPKNFEGYLYGDLLYSPDKPFVAGKQGIQFTPNKVTYTVNPNSEIGKRIAQSKVGVTVHNRFDSFGSKSGVPVDDVADINSKDVMVIGQTYVAHQPSVDTSETDSIRKFAKANARSIDTFLAPQQGMSDLKQIIYKFVNTMSKAQRFDALNSKGFFDWLKTSTVSNPKQQKIYQLYQTNSAGMDSMFKLVNRIMSVKNNIIDQLDDAPADVKASTGDAAGGEGYVAQRSKIKLVPRHRWSPN